MKDCKHSKWLSRPRKPDAKPAVEKTKTQFHLHIGIPEGSELAAPVQTTGGEEGGGLNTEEQVKLLQPQPEPQHRLWHRLDGHSVVSGLKSPCPAALTQADFISVHNSTVDASASHHPPTQPPEFYR